MSCSADGDDAVEFKRAASNRVASEAAMVLSEARGPVPISGYPSDIPSFYDFIRAILVRSCAGSS
jgi:hypothetical protein